jgi:hypothetical protein
MKLKKLFVCSLVAGGVAAMSLSAVAVAAKSQGTDILHFFVRKSMTNEGAEAGVAGTVDAKQNRQGRADNQRLEIVLSGLATNASYHLFAVIDEDTSNFVHVAEFNANADGDARLRYRSHGNGNSVGKGKAALPALLNPLADVRQLAVFNSSTQAVVTADLTDPDKLHYLIKRSLSTNGIDASLRIKATTTDTQFRLVAVGLAPTNNYQLVLNGEAAQAVSTDAAGVLNVEALPGSMPILDLRSVGLWDSVSNLVLSTDLP